MSGRPAARSYNLPCRNMSKLRIALSSRDQGDHFRDLDEFAAGRKRTQPFTQFRLEGVGTITQLFRRGGRLRKCAADDLVLGDGLADGDAQTIEPCEGRLVEEGFVAAMAQRLALRDMGLG